MANACSVLRSRSFFACVVRTGAFPASAGETNVDLRVGPLVGTHAESGVLDTVAPVPIPFIALAHRESFVELFAEGLPISPAIDSTSARESLATRLTFENVVLRVYVAHDRLSLGAGETIYNQTTRYAPTNQIDSSRVAGGRYELAFLPFANRGFRASFDEMATVSC
jgi:hypothetical protein